MQMLTSITSLYKLTSSHASTLISFRDKSNWIIPFLSCSTAMWRAVNLWGCGAKKTTSLNLKGLWHAFEHLQPFDCWSRSQGFLVKKSFSIDLEAWESFSNQYWQPIWSSINCLSTVFLITQTSATNLQCDYCNQGHLDKVDWLDTGK